MDIDEDFDAGWELSEITDYIDKFSEHNGEFQSGSERADFAVFLKLLHDHWENLTDDQKRSAEGIRKQFFGKNPDMRQEQEGEAKTENHARQGGEDNTESNPQQGKGIESIHPGSKKDVQRIETTREICRTVAQDLERGEHLNTEGKITKGKYFDVVKVLHIEEKGQKPHRGTMEEGWKALPLEYKLKGRQRDQ